ncbi:alpha-L-arabinofuranosidase [Pseudotabrizicola alkalilacus]|uniref:Alpha-L-arabinofuranosidase n=1 Tax=Pseudotabrizicola alkalilacus TaxID=2305252 RepID=A0A411YZU2_9RHOB|nr:alpha-L-arabinofuranosidase [Pseudotabrizicola alkalilacus]RGP36322.1 alpha-L-arabinofuranosidase [Pseudotabrizicola alkalilacus]
MLARFLRLIVILAVLVLPGCADEGQAGTFANGDFETVENDRPVGWSLSDVAATKGTVAVVKGELVLRPNELNTPSDTPLGLGQAIDATSLRGQRLTLSARLSGADGAVAVVGVAALDTAGQVERFVVLRAAPGDEQNQTTTDAEPLSESVKTLIVFVSAEGTKGTATIDDVAVGGMAATQPTTPDEALTFFTLQADGKGRTIPADILGTNVEWIRDGNGLWNKAQGQLDADIIAMSAQAGIRMIRFPGGVWSDTYDWRDGIGPQSARPTTRHIPDQDETSHHSIGTPEIVDFATRIGAQLMITVNAGHGTPEQAAAWAAHIRDTHGLAIAPVWEIGNELYMENDMSGGSMTPEVYAEKLRAFEAAIRAELPDARIAGIGLVNYGPYRFNAHDDWNRIVLEQAGDVIDVFAVHNAYAPLVVESSSRRWAEVYRAMLASPVTIAQNLSDTAALIDASVSPAKRGKIAIAVTEWGPSYSYDPKNPYFDHVKTMGSALFVARTLNVFMRDARVDSAQFFKLSDWLNMGWIGPVKGGGWRETPALMALGLYRDAPGATLLPLDRREGPTFASSHLGFQPAVEAAPLVDAVAFRDAAGKITLIASNADLEQPREARFTLSGGAADYKVTAHSMSGPSAVAHRDTIHIDVPGVPFAAPGQFGNGDWFARASADSITLETGTAGWADGTLTLQLPPAGIMAVTLVSP